MTAHKPNFNIDTLYLARKDELSEGERYGYLRALADTQPRIDALVAALAGLLPYAERGIVESMAQDEEDVPGKLNALWSLVDIARAALKLAGEE